MDNIYNIINNYYNKQSYTARYGADLLITGIICTIVFCIFSYYHAMNNIRPILADWPNQRCKPNIMPFAGLINSTSGQSILEYTANNFTNCIQSNIGQTHQYTQINFYYAINIITNVFNILVRAVQFMRVIINRIRKSTQKIFKDVLGRHLNTILPLVSIFQYIKDIMAKTVGTLTAALFTVFGGYYTLIGVFNVMYEFIINILFMIVAGILVCFAIGWLFPPVLAVGFSLAGFLALLLIPVIFIQIFMKDVLKTSGANRNPPGVPGYCFAGDTKLTLQDGTKCLIKHIKLGDMLEDGSIVTARMVSTAADSTFVQINETIVTAGHAVYHPTKGWIEAKNHPLSKYINNFHDTYVYCLGTNTKTIRIGEIVYADWDEIDDDDMIDLQKYARKNTETFIPYPFKRTDIHPYLDTGLSENTSVCLEDGTIVNIKELQVNDVLLFGEQIKSIVEIDCRDIEFYYTYYVDKRPIFCGTGNLEIDTSLLGDEVKIRRELTSTPMRAYHVITDSGIFNIQGVLVGDYNRGIDRYLSTTSTNSIFYSVNSIYNASNNTR
jgi:hypothetical protein